MTDFLDSLPIPTSHPTLKRAILQFIITVICLILCILKDPRYSVSPFLFHPVSSWAFHRSVSSHWW